MNIRQIKPKQSWTPEVGNITIDSLCLKDFIHYFFDNGSGVVSYTLKSNDTDYFNNNIDIPAFIIQQWGTSDDIIFEYVAEQLGLELI